MWGSVVAFQRLQLGSQPVTFLHDDAKEPKLLDKKETVSSQQRYHLFVYCVGETERKRSLIITHGPSNPTFLYACTYCYSVGGLP